MLNRVLFVDDEPNVLQALERQLRKQCEIQTAASPDCGLQMIAENGPFAVVVSDLRMPDMDGIEFLTRVRHMAPETVRIMLTGNADLRAAVTAVNEGKIFQFLMKPCPNDMLLRSLGAALEQYRLITAERELLERTLHGSIGILTEILSLVNPAAFSRAQRIRRYVRHMAEKLNFRDHWQFELAAMLSQIGCVVIPPHVLDKAYLRQPLTDEEKTLLGSQSQVAYDLLAKIPRLEHVAQMVAEQSLAWPGNPDRPEVVRIGAHLLRVALDFDETTLRGRTLNAAIVEMRYRKEYNPNFVDALEQVHLESAETEVRAVRLPDLRAGMILDADLFSKTGVLLLAKGQQVTDSAIARLAGFASMFGVVEPISVLVPAAEGQAADKKSASEFSDGLVIPPVAMLPS